MPDDRSATEAAIALGQFKDHGILPERVRDRVLAGATFGVVLDLMLLLTVAYSAAAPDR